MRYPQNFQTMEQNSNNQDKKRVETLDNGDMIFLRELHFRGNYVYPKTRLAFSKKVFHAKLIRMGYLTGMLTLTEKGRETAKSIL